VVSRRSAGRGCTASELVAGQREAACARQIQPQKPTWFRRQGRCQRVPPIARAPHLGKFGAILADFIASVPSAVSSEEPTVIRGAAAATTLLCCCCTDTRCWRSVRVYQQHWQPPGGLQDALPKRSEVLQEEVRGLLRTTTRLDRCMPMLRARINCPHHSKIEQMHEADSMKSESSPTWNWIACLRNRQSRTR
jgi:hypothetical protein